MISLGAVAINKKGDNFGDFKLICPMENSVSDPAQWIGLTVKHLMLSIIVQKSNSTRSNEPIW